MRGCGLVLFACAGLSLSGGAVLGGSAAWSMVRMCYYFWTTDLGVELSSVLLLIVGAVLCLPVCWLATVVPYHTKSTSLVATLITLSTASMLMLSLGVSSMSGLSRALRDTAALNASMHRAMSHVTFNQAVRSSFANMQIELKCCGVQSSADWLNYRHTLPPACCGRLWYEKRADYCESPTYTSGCLAPALFELRNVANTFTVLACAVIVVMAVALFAGAYSLASEVIERSMARSKTNVVRTMALPLSQAHPLSAAYLAVSAPPSTITQV